MIPMAGQFKSAITCKADFVVSNTGSLNLYKYDQFSRTLINRFKDMSSSIPSMLKFIQMELAYPVLRHQLWTGHSYFKIIYRQFIRELLHCSAETSEVVSDSILEFFSEIFDRSEVRRLQDSEDVDFIFYLYVLTLSCSGSQNIVDELGLGVAIVKKLLKMSQVYQSLSQGERDVVMSADDPDCSYLKALHDLSEKRLKYSSYLSLLSLRYLLCDLPEAWDEYIEHDDCCHDIIVLLTDVGFTKKYSVGQFITHWCQMTPQDFQSLNPSELLLELKKKDLIYFQMEGRGRSKKSENTRMLLTQKGYEMTARYFSESCSDRVQCEDLFRHSLDPSWQSAWIKKRSKDDSNFMTELAGIALGLPMVSEPVFLAVCDDLEAQERRGELDQWLGVLLENSRNPVFRMKICEKLSEPTMPEASCQRLEIISKKDHSQEVRDMAGYFLAKRTGQ